jgi:hypothetical protein
MCIHIYGLVICCQQCLVSYVNGWCVCVCSEVDSVSSPDKQIALWMGTFCHHVGTIDPVLIRSSSLLFSYFSSLDLFSLEVTSTNINWYVTLLFIIKEEVFCYTDHQVHLHRLVHVSWCSFLNVVYLRR